MPTLHLETTVAAGHNEKIPVNEDYVEAVTGYDQAEGSAMRCISCRHALLSA